MNHRYRTLLAGATTAAALALAAATSAGEPVWLRQAPYPADVDLLGVCFITPDHGFIVGADGLFMETADGGAEWAQIADVQRDPQFLEDPIWDVQFLDPLNGWAVGNRVYRTSDGGAAWVDLGSLGSIYGVDAISPSTAYQRSNLSIHKTTDGGATFSMIWDWQDFDPIADMNFFDASLGVVVGRRNDVPGVYRTTDGGQSWQLISDEVLSRILYVTEDVLVATRYASFYRSSDGGATWQLVLDDSGELNDAMEALRRIDADSFAAIDINARIWVSDDAGATWTRTFGPLGNWGYEWDLRFPDASTGYAVGRLGLILKTTDGGHSWTQVSNGAARSMNDIVMLDSGVGIAVGDSGVIVRTTDFGCTWTVLPQANNGGYSFNVETVEAIDADTIVAGGGVNFLRSDDAGATWTLHGPVPGGCNDLSFTDESNGWSFGDNAIAGTTDGGQTWTTLHTPNPPIIEGQVMPSGRGWALVPQTEQSITDDGFDQSYIPRTLPGGESWQEFEFASDNVGWYGGFFGGLLKSSNGGFIFQQQFLPQPVDRLDDVRAISESEVYVATHQQGANYQGVIYHSLDGGSTWTAMGPISDSTNQFAGALVEIDVTPFGGVWALGSGGFIFANGAAAGGNAPADTNIDGVVDALDFLALIAEWGSPPPHTSDIAPPGGDGVVDALDLLQLIANWGPASSQACGH